MNVEDNEILLNKFKELVELKEKLELVNIKATDISFDDLIGTLDKLNNLISSVAKEVENIEENNLKEEPNGQPNGQPK